MSIGSIHRRAFEQCRVVLETYGEKHPEVAKEVKHLLDHNLNVRTIGAGRQRTNFGVCSFEKTFFGFNHKAVFGATITYNKKLTDDGNERRFLSTLVHEILHSCAENVDCNCHHGGAWKEMADLYNEMYPEDEVISRLGSWTREMTLEDTKPKSRPEKYQVYCEECGYSKNYKVKSKVVKDAFYGVATCKHCGKPLYMKYI